MDKKEIEQIITQNFKEKTILVVGDIMIDKYVIGKVSRISPEAPVPVLNHIESNFVAGGAANVAYNLSELGCNVILVGVAAEDEEGIWLKDHLAKKRINVEGVIAEKARPTTVKTRYATKGQQLLRVDIEKNMDLLHETKTSMKSYIEKKIQMVDGIILSDYRKGVLEDSSFVERIIRLAKLRDIPVAVDSKSRNISVFKDADFVKPNNLELENAVGIHISDEETLDIAGERYLKESEACALVVTRGANGISLFRKNEKRLDFPAKCVQVYDVTGAGDTVISTILLCMICGIDICQAVKLANIAAGVVIAKVGTAAVSCNELVEAINEY